MPAVNAVSTMLDSLAAGYLKGVCRSENFESFQVKTGDKTGAGGVLSGVLSDKDYTTFNSVVKDLNVKSASYKEMSEVYRKLAATGLVSENDILTSFMGSSEHDTGGYQVNGNAKYNQWQYQKDALASYADPMLSETRDRALNTFKLMAAIANASPVTGQTVARESVSAQDREQAVQVDLSEEARRRARKEGYGIEDREPDESKFMNKLLEEMKRIATAAKAAENVQAAEAEATASAPPPIPPST